MVLSEADLRRRDSRKLKESFFSSVDDSQISSLVRAYQENSGVMPHLASGLVKVVTWRYGESMERLCP